MTAARFLYPGAGASVVLTLLPDLTPEPAPAFPYAGIAAERLNARLTPEMRQNFDLFLYVSKAEHGPLAQRMMGFGKEAGETLKPVFDWAASTGREQAEVNIQGRHVMTATPAGFYELDPSRMFRSYRSFNWDRDMPDTMFFDWTYRGRRTGLASHAAAGDDIAKLGNRASGGCVHLSPQNAAMLYDLIRKNYRGAVPLPAYNSETGSTSNRGLFVRDTGGALKMADGYRVLVIVEDYGGQNDVTDDPARLL